MKTSRTFTVVAAVAVAGLFATGVGLAQRTPPALDPHAAHHTMMDDCAKACHECQRACDACAHHCATMAVGGKKEHVKAMHTCQDCAAFCAMTGRVAGSHGPFSHLAADACATACERCAVACEELRDDAKMKHCAEECRRCQKSCQQMGGDKTTVKTTAVK